MTVINRDLQDQINAALKRQKSKDSEEKFNGGSELLDVIDEHISLFTVVGDWDILPQTKTNLVNGLLKHCELVVEKQVFSGVDAFSHADDVLCSVYDSVGYSGFTPRQLKRLLSAADRLCSREENVVDCNNDQPFNPKRSLVELFDLVTVASGKEYKGKNISTHFYQAAQARNVALVVKPDNGQPIMIVGRSAMNLREIPALAKIAERNMG